VPLATLADGGAVAAHRASLVHTDLIDTGAPSRRKAARATNESQFNQPSSDPARPTQKLLAGKGSRSTPSDSDRLPKQAWISLTRKRSLVQNPVRPTRSQHLSPRNTSRPALRSIGPEASIRGLSRSRILALALPRFLVLIGVQPTDPPGSWRPG
jgi:hypothetical protein